jgi:hypothetical protein
MKKLLAFTVFLFSFILPVSNLTAMADEDIPIENIGAICYNGKKVSVTGSGACLNYWGRKFWVMPNGTNIPSQDYLDPWFLDEPYYSNWRVCNLQSDVNEWSKCHDKLQLKFPQRYLDDELVSNSNSSSPVTVTPYAYNTFVTTGAICFDGWRSASTGSGTCSWHGGVSKWLGSDYSTYKLPSLSYSTPSYGSSNCVGMCYGSPSKVNGLPRDTPVSGYFKANGTWVNPYTRSKP